MRKLAETSHASADVPKAHLGVGAKGNNVLPIGVVLKQMRGERTLRDVELGTGIANSRLSNVERGHGQPGLKFLGRMADYYQTSVAEIIRRAELLRDYQADPYGVSAAEVERSYQFVAEDPRLQPWEEPDEVLSVAAKKQVIRTYELLTGKTLLSPTSGVP